MPKQYPVQPIPIELFNETDIVYIVAGGPSLRTLSWERLKEKKVIAINKSMFKCPDAKIIWWADDRFWEENRDEILAHKARYKVTAYSDLVRFHYPGEVYAYKFTRQRGLDDSQWGICSGNNSGYACINLATKLGARRIVLLGYDFKYSGEGHSHWHDGYYLPDGSRRNHREETLTRKMLPNFDSLVDPLIKKRVQVYNASMDSNLTIWPKITIDEALNLA